MRFLSLTRLAHFYPCVSSDPFPTGVHFLHCPIYPSSVHRLVRFTNFRPLCPYSIILIIQGRLRVGRGCIRVNNEWSEIMKNSSFHRTVENDENCITSQWAIFNPLLLIQFVLENARFFNKLSENRVFELDYRTSTHWLGYNYR